MKLEHLILAPSILFHVCWAMSLKQEIHAEIGLFIASALVSKVGKSNFVEFFLSQGSLIALGLCTSPS